MSISSVIGDDSFGAGLTSGEILFQRVVAGKTTSDQFIWDPGTGTATQLTDNTDNHSVVKTYAADNS